MLEVKIEKQAGASFHPPKHIDDLDGTAGEEMDLTEWLDGQTRVACLAIVEMLRNPRATAEEQGKRMPSVPKEQEDTVYHLLQIYEHGYSNVPESKDVVRQHEEAKVIMNQWATIFGPLFNILCKKREIRYEVAAKMLDVFQRKIVEHTQNARRIWEDHRGQTNEVLNDEDKVLAPSKPWKKIECGDPHIVNEDGIEFLQRTVYLPEVVGYGADTQLVLDSQHFYREEFIKRLTPYNQKSLTPHNQRS